MEHHFDVDEAVIYGVEKAVMLNNFRFWLTKNRANNHQNIDDYYWTFNSATALAEIWPYLNAKKISRLLKELEVSGALITGNYNKAGYDRTKWYSMPEFSVKALPIVISQKCEMDYPNIGNGLPKYGQPIPYINPDKKPDIKTKDIDFGFLSESEFNELTEIRIENYKAQEKKAPEMTQRIADTLIKEIGLAVDYGFTVDDVLSQFATRSWLSFQFKWIAPKKNIKTDTNNNTGGQYAVNKPVNNSAPARVRAINAAKQAQRDRTERAIN